MEKMLPVIIQDGAYLEKMSFLTAYEKNSNYRWKKRKSYWILSWTGDDRVTRQSEPECGAGYFAKETVLVCIIRVSREFLGFAEAV